MDTQHLNWTTPDFAEWDTAAEVTAYAGQWGDEDEEEAAGELACPATA
jgi:coenzyme PQQ precursor peptide PqqA